MARKVYGKSSLKEYESGKKFCQDARKTGANVKVEVKRSKKQRRKIKKRLKMS